VLADGESFIVSMRFMDSALRHALVEKYSTAAVTRVVDAAGQPAGHRPGFLFDSDTARGESPAEMAYREKVARLDTKTRKQPDDDDEDDDGDGSHQESETARRERLAKRAALAPVGSDARQPTLDEAIAARDAALEARDERKRNAWKTR
jgi:hypothetical protein